MSTARNARTWTVRSPEDLGRALRGVRDSRGLTQASVAESAAMDRTYLARLESGPNSIALERTLRALRRMGAQVEVKLPAGDDG